jgi:hypothetical protein
MKILPSSLILNFVFVSLLPNNVTYAQNFDGEISFDRIQELAKSTADQPEYQAAMQLLRLQMRFTLLPNLWKATQENPDFQVGAVRTSDLFQKLNRFNLFQNDSEFVLQADQERKSDFYVLNENWGAINTEQMRPILKTESGLILPLHIFLGANGYQDENYQLSLALVLLDKSMSANSDLEKIGIPKLFPQKKEDLYRLEPQLIKKGPDGDKQKLLRRSKGGFTGVGGGGDGRSLQVKFELISKYLFAFSNPKLSSQACFRKWADPLAFLQDVFEVEIESSMQVEEVKLDYSENNWRILLPFYDPLDKQRLQTVMQQSLVILCHIQSMKNEEK